MMHKILSSTLACAVVAGTAGYVVLEPARPAGVWQPLTPDNCVFAFIDHQTAEREVFDLVRIQGMPHGEVAEILGVSTKTVQRRLHRGMVLLVDALHDLRPPAADGGRSG